MITISQENGYRFGIIRIRSVFIINYKRIYGKEKKIVLTKQYFDVLSGSGRERKIFFHGYTLCTTLYYIYLHI